MVTLLRGGRSRSLFITTVSLSASWRGEDSIVTPDTGGGEVGCINCGPRVSTSGFELEIEAVSTIPHSS